MGLMDKLRGELIDVIEWTQPNESDILAYRFPRYGNEIKNGAKLTVREGQAAVFVNEGQLADVFTPGMYELNTANLPILSTLKGWKYGFESPFKAEIYFVVTTQQTDYKWGTSNPIILRDPDFGMVRVRAFGSYAFRVSDPASFLRELVSTDPQFEDYEIDAQLRQAIVSKFADAVGAQKIPVVDLVGNYDQLGAFVEEVIHDDFASFGLELTKFYVENVSVPPAVEAAIDKRAEMGALGNLDQYAKFQAAEAMRDAAQNQGGGAGMGMGLGAGLAMGQQMAGSMAGVAAAPGQVQQPATAPGGPPPLPGNVQLYVAIGGNQSGPFDMGTVQSLVRGGQLKSDTLVWKAGMAGWDKAAAIPELTGLFGSTPPPLPPQ